MKSIKLLLSAGLFYMLAVSFDRLGFVDYLELTMLPLFLGLALIWIIYDMDG